MRVGPPGWLGCSALGFVSSLPLRFAWPAYPLACWLGVEIAVIVAVDTLAYGPVVPVCAAGVLVVVQDSEMVRVDASPALAEMVQSHPCGNWPVYVLPRCAVGQDDISFTFVPVLPPDLCVSVASCRVGTDSAITVRLPPLERPLLHSVWNDCPVPVSGFRRAGFHPHLPIRLRWLVALPTDQQAGCCRLGVG